MTQTSDNQRGLAWSCVYQIVFFIVYSVFFRKFGYVEGKKY